MNSMHIIVIISIQLLPWCLSHSRHYEDDKPFDFKTEFSEDVTNLYKQYLVNLKTKLSSRPECSPQSRTVSPSQNLDPFYKEVQKSILLITDLDQRAMNTKPRYKAFDKDTYLANRQALFNELATKSLLKSNKCLTKWDAVTKLVNVSVQGQVQQKTIDSGFCETESDVSLSVKCDHKYKYRRIDGKCNNLKNTNWGSALHCQRRLLPPDYSDGINKIRLSTDGTPLPNARLLSRQLFRENYKFSDNSLLNTMWGQLIAHDSFLRVLYSGGLPDCCAQNRSHTHPECIQIDDMPDDPLTVAYRQKCMPIVRAVACNTCRLGHRNQVNEVTPVLDLSNVYNFRESEAKNLRTFRGGKLITNKALDGTHLLPRATVKDQDNFQFDQCFPPADRPWLTCFKNGDKIRGNQNPAGTALVALLVIRHNQHCDGLSRVNPRWNDEKLFQEARRLLIAEYNHIIYGEYLPILLGKRLMKKYSLNVKTNGFTQYNPQVDPTGIQAVGGAAFRFGHMTTITTFHVSAQEIKSNAIKSNKIRRLDDYEFDDRINGIQPLGPLMFDEMKAQFDVHPNKHKSESFTYRLRDKYFEMSDLWDGRTNDIIRGLTEVPEKVIGPHIIEDLQDYLFLNKCRAQINDLAATNIMRGRDYGLPAYYYYLQYFTTKAIKSWNDFKGFIPNIMIEKLKMFYKDYRDVDLYVGGIMENDVLTFRNLLALQFFHWKFGDRFYFEHSKQSGSFTQNQLNDIRDMSSMANLLCKTTDFETISANPLRLSSKNNPKIFCRQFKEINYNLFRE